MVELTLYTPVTKDSTKNVLPKVISKPNFNEFYNSPKLARDIEPKYPQRTNKGALKKYIYMNLSLKLRLIGT